MGQPRVGFVPRAQEASLATAEHGSRHGKPTPSAAETAHAAANVLGQKSELAEENFPVSGGKDEGTPTAKYTQGLTWRSRAAMSQNLAHIAAGRAAGAFTATRWPRSPP